MSISLSLFLSLSIGRSSGVILLSQLTEQRGTRGGLGMSNPISERRVANGKTRGSRRYASTSGTHKHWLSPAPHERPRRHEHPPCWKDPPAFQYEMTVASSPSTVEGAHLSLPPSSFSLFRADPNGDIRLHQRMEQGGGRGRIESSVVVRAGRRRCLPPVGFCAIRRRERERERD